MKRKTLVLLGTLLLLLAMNIALVPAALAAGPNAIRSGFDDVTLPRNDDYYTSAQAIGFPIDFLGNSYTQVYVNNNGNITFDNPMSTYTPFNLYSAGRVIIAPFFADVDTRYAGNPVEYQLWSTGQDTVDGHPAFGATWRDVDYYLSSTSHTNRNHFQVILIDRSDTGLGNFDIEFNYDQIRWEAGTASGGNSQGLGGHSARAGYSNGNAANSYELPGSAVNGAFLDSNSNTGLIHNSMNSNQLGRYVFQIRNGNPVEADLSISKTGSPGSVSVGQNIDYTISVTNNGPEDATGVSVKDILPSGTSFVSASVPTSITGNLVTLDMGTIADGGSATATLTATVSSATATLITNSATVSSDLPDPIDGNNTATAVTTVNLNSSPTANAGPDQTVEQASLDGTDVTLDGSASTDDGQLQSLTYSWTWAGGSASGVNPTVSLPLGTTTVALEISDGQYTATDEVVITVQDTTAPMLSLPANVTVEQESAAGTAVVLSATATDICDADVTITRVPNISVYPLGTTRVTFTATDDAGNQSSGIVNIKVTDTTAPVLNLPADITVEQESAAGTMVALNTTATDICDTNVTVTSDAPPGGFPLGTTVVNFTATDDSGNQTNGAVSVTVQDTTAPSVDAGFDITVEQASLDGGPAAIPTPAVSDICDANPAVIIDGLMDVYPLGDTTITVTATDFSGNTAQDTMTVHVVDTTAPEVSIDNLTDGQEFWAGETIDVQYTVSDICDAAPTVTVTPADTIDPPLNVGSLTITVTAEDASGNVDSASVTVEVIPVPATVDFDPDTFNIGNNGQWATVYIEMPEGYDVHDIDGSTVMLNGQIPACLDKLGWAKADANDSNIMDHDGDGISERMVKFDRAAVEAILTPGEEVQITVTGEIAGAQFEGFDIIRVIQEGTTQEKTNNGKKK